MNEELENAIIAYEERREKYGSGNLGENPDAGKIYEFIEKKLIEQKKKEGFTCQFLVEFMSFRVDHYGLKSALCDLLIQHSSAEDWTVEVFAQFERTLREASFPTVEKLLEVLFGKLIRRNVQLSTLLLHYLYTRPWLSKFRKDLIEKCENFNKNSTMILNEIEKISQS